jgi:hypothetical protein
MKDMVEKLLCKDPEKRPDSFTMLNYDPIWKEVIKI